MIKTCRIIPLVFILFLFGFTFSTVSPVFAQDPMLEMRIITLEDQVRALQQNHPRDKDPFTYSPDGKPVRQSPDGKFHCVGFPEIRENPDEPKGAAYAKCKQKSGDAKR